MKNSSADYVIRVHTEPGELPLEAWNALLAQQASPSPFMRLEYLQALHESGSATAETDTACLRAISAAACSTA